MSLREMHEQQKQSSPREHFLIHYFLQLGGLFLCIFQ